MSKKIFKFIIISSYLTLLPACLLTRHDIRNQENEKQLEIQVKNLQTINADTENHVVNLDQSVRELSGRVEIIENNSKTGEQKKANKDLEKETKLQIYEQAISKNEKEIQILKDELLGLKKLIKLKKVAKSKKAKTKKKNIPKGNYTSGQYHFNKKDWKNAITGYQKYREMNPKGKRYAESTYKIGVCFHELGMTDNAKIFFQEVVEKYPKSKESKKSKYRMKKL